MQGPPRGANSAPSQRPLADTRAPDEGDGPLGHMFENRQLRTALLEAAMAAPLADVRMRTRAVSVARGEFGVTAVLDSGATVHAALLVAA